MQPRGERTDGDRVEPDVQRIETDDHHRSGLGHFRPLSGIERGPANLVAFHRFLGALDDDSFGDE